MRKTHRILALDFDGVLCDSAAETAASAWRAGKKIWHHWDAPEPPLHWVQRFCEVRPYLETGYQAVPMLRLIDLQAPPRAFSHELDARVEKILDRTGLSRAEMVDRFGRARDHWMATDLDSWLQRHRFFPGTLDRVRARMGAGDDVYILTTKQERFVHALLNSADLSLAPGRVYGLERERKKEAILKDLLKEQQPILFVEDRLDTLMRVLAEPELRGVGLQYADWGYGTAQHLAAAGQNPAITVVSLDQFLLSEKTTPPRS